MFAQTKQNKLDTQNVSLFQANSIIKIELPADLPTLCEKKIQSSVF